MLARVLEAEVMETLADARDYDAMDHSEVNRLFVDELLAAAPELSTDTQYDVLDLGTGTARIPIELAGRPGICRIMAVDMAVNMLDLCRLNVEIAGRMDRITLDQVDAKQLPYEDNQFDVVMSNSIVHHIPDPVMVIDEAIRVTKPGGLLFFRDLCRPTDEKILADLIDQYGGDTNEHARKLFGDSLRASLNEQEIRDLVVRLGFSPQDAKATTDRHWTWSSRKRNVI